jgi:hypothetical protein
LSKLICLEAAVFSPVVWFSSIHTSKPGTF